MKTIKRNSPLTRFIAGILLVLPALCVGQPARPISLVDSTFNPGTGPDGEVLTVALQADGRILIGGDFRTVDGSPRSGVARLRQDGAVDSSFAPVIEQREDSPRKAVIR